MILKTMKCPECDSEIMFSYTTPEKAFEIEDGKIIRADAWTGEGYDNSYIQFYCSNDREHNIDSQQIQQWQEDVEHEFERQNLFAA